MKTQEELKQIKEEVETLNKKLVDLTDEELEQVSGGKNPYAYIRYETTGEVGLERKMDKILTASTTIEPLQASPLMRR